jgi:hypothetical protein
MVTSNTISCVEDELFILQNLKGAAFDFIQEVTLVGLWYWDLLT